MGRTRTGKAHRLGLPVLLFILLVAFYFFLHSSIFNITGITVTGIKTLDKSEVIALSGLRTGVNIFEVDTDKSARAVMTHPRIKQCDVVRHLPSHMEIRVVERVPWAVVPTGTAFLLVDDEGVIMEKLDTWPPQEVPVVTTDTIPSRSEPGMKIKGVNTVAHIVRSLPAKSLSISEYHYDNQGEVTIYTCSGVEIRMGDDSNLKDKIDTWPEVVKLVNTSERPIAYIDLRFKGHPVIRYKGSV